jgi:hypothetical protein
MTGRWDFISLHRGCCVLTSPDGVGSVAAVLDGGMAMGFRPVDRDQQFLLPVDMREWLPEDHVVWVLLEVVDHLDLAWRSGMRWAGWDGGPMTRG